MTTTDRLAIYERDGGICGFCGKPVSHERFHVDHIKPQAEGGTSAASNLRVAHPICNIAAGSKARVGFPTRWSGPTKAIRLRVRDDLILQLRQIAESEERSINFVAARLLRQALALPPKR